LGLLLQQESTATTTTQGDSMVSWLSAYGLQALLVMVGAAVIGIVVAALWRKKGNSRGNGKKL
jgi:hypothetical protein